MSRKRVIIAVVLAALVAVWWLRREPIVQGKAISVWAEQFRTGNEKERQQASGALIELGPDCSRIIADDPRLAEMLPDHWAAAHPEAVLTYWLEESRRKAAAQRDRRSRRRTLANARRR